MKHRITICVEEDTAARILDRLKSKRFRNKSHFVECAIENYLEGEQNVR